MRRHTVVACGVVVALSLAGVRPSEAQPESVADPIRCWWRTSAGAVSTGEPFAATLTCAVREADDLRAVPDETGLDAGAVQLSPFEVLGGSHPPDERSATHRFLQYHYMLRIIDRDAIGHDARFPDVRIPYRVHTRVSGDWAAGRDRVYVMPGQSVRVLSLVPAEADDIRDSADATFARIGDLRFRARALWIASLALAGLAVVVALPAALTLVRQRRAAGDRDTPIVSRRAVLRTAQRELDAVHASSRGGWTADLAARALSATRLVAAIALRRPPTVRASGSGDNAGAVLPATVGTIRRRRVTLSSAATTAHVQDTLARAQVPLSPAERQLLETVSGAMTVLTAATYGRSGSTADAALDAAISDLQSALQALRRRR
jgi:hypothetical protein